MSRESDKHISAKSLTSKGHNLPMSLVKKARVGELHIAQYPLENLLEDLTPETAHADLDIAEEPPVGNEVL